MANALKNIMPTSVTMKGGILSRATAVPLNQPISTPTSNIAKSPRARRRNSLPAGRPPL
jgi:hypothetical protein